MPILYPNLTKIIAYEKISALCSILNVDVAGYC